MSSMTSTLSGRRTPMQKVIDDIVEATGLKTEFETADEFYLCIYNEPYMRLVIEAHPAGDDFGTGATRFISIAHYAEKAHVTDDPIVDTDLEMLNNGVNVGLTVGYGRFYTRVYRRNDEGKAVYSPRAKSEVDSFARMWAGNVRGQGFIKAAKDASNTTVRVNGETIREAVR